MKVSIITVCFNRAVDIQDCLRSVASQTYDNIEHIIIDGASTDQTVSVVQRFSHVAKIISEPDKGIYDAMNKGIAHSTGELIYFLNADDMFISATALEDAINAITDDPDGDVYYGWLEVRLLSGAPILYKPPGPEHGPELMVTGCLPHQSTITRRATFDKTGLFDLSYRYHADYDWFIKVLANPTITIKSLDLPIGSFRAGGASSQLAKGQPEVFRIQASTPLYASTEWDKRRIQLLQEVWLAARIENDQLRQSVDHLREQLTNSGITPELAPHQRRSLHRRVIDVLPSAGRDALVRLRGWLIHR